MIGTYEEEVSQLARRHTYDVDTLRSGGSVQPDVLFGARVHVEIEKKGEVTLGTQEIIARLREAEAQKRFR
jgi:hypothetical protein